MISLAVTVLLLLAFVVGLCTATACYYVREARIRMGIALPRRSWRERRRLRRNRADLTAMRVRA